MRSNVMRSLAPPSHPLAQESSKLPKLLDQVRSDAQRLGLQEAVIHRERDHQVFVFRLVLIAQA